MNDFRNTGVGGRFSNSATYVDPVVYRELESMETNLRQIIQSRAAPETMLPGLRATLATLQVAIKGMVPEPEHTWGPDSPGAA